MPRLGMLTERECLRPAPLLWKFSRVKIHSEGLRDGSEVKSTGYTSKGPEFNSQQPRGGSQPSVMKYGALFWPAGTYANRLLYT